MAHQISKDPRNWIAYRVRPSLTDDMLNSLNARAWPAHVDRSYARVLSQSLAYVAAFDDDRLIGFINVATDGDRHAFILDVAVDRDHQRRGIGTELLRMAIRIATEAGCEWVHVDYESHLDDFYTSAGFRPTSAGLIHLSS